MRNNAEPEDGAALRTAWGPVDDPHVQHDLVFDVVQLLQANARVRDVHLALYV